MDIPKKTINATSDPDDNRIVECAVEAGSDIVISNDRSLLRLKHYQGVQMMTPTQFFERL